MPTAPILFIQQYWNAGLEIVLFAVGLYYLYLYFRGTRGARVLTGLVLFLGGLVIASRLFNLVVIRWLLDRYSVFLVVVLVVLFQPELRRALAELGSRRLYTGRGQDQRMLDRLCACVFELAGRHCGALIAMEREIGLRSYAETGVSLDAVFSTELLTTIFHPKTALHDGGLILHDERIVAAACIFPVSQKESLDRSFGLRHRAGLGLCEETDAVAVVVSEETGSVSLCYNRRIERGLSPQQLRERLRRILFEGSGRFPRTSLPGNLQPAPADDDNDLDTA